MLAVARLLVERAARWFLRSRPHIDIAAEVALFNGDVDHIAEVDGLLRGAERAAYDRTRQRLVDAGVGEELADWVAGLESDFASLDIIDAARRRDRDPVHVARVYFALSDRLGLDWLQLRIARLPDQDRWQSLARNALRDDLYAARIALTDLVLGSEDDDDIDGAVERWIVSRGAAVTRAAQVLSDVREADGQDVTALSVALREVRSLVTSAS
jgi:glutamate dehydrogenase